MKLKSVKKELKEAFQNSLLTTEEWEALVEESKTNKELEVKLNEAQEQFKSITDGEYESDDFVTSVKALNGAIDFAEVLRGWDIVEKKSVNIKTFIKWGIPLRMSILSLLSL